MSGYVDLHCHYLPGIDDGVRTADEGLRVLAGLHDLGWARVIATPHIRTAMFDNRAPGLRRAFDEMAEIVAGAERMPELGLSAEHYCDDVFWDLFMRGEALPYPGGKAALVEFHYESWPRNVERRFFEMQVRGVRPVIAHPERYQALFRSTDPLDPMLDVGALTLLDVMSLAGRYGERPRRTAERMLEEGAYDAACTDAHRPDDVAIVERALERLRELVGAEETELLLGEHPRAILDGRYDP
ncbi:MAG: protein tyrosine phosphatase [Myxococcota bacterium]|nr:protein tyrosine phosphatase [Myxococcota bacterium]